VVPSASAWPSAASHASNKWTSSQHTKENSTYAQHILPQNDHIQNNLASSFASISFVDNLSPDAWSPRSHAETTTAVSASSSSSSIVESSPIPSPKKKKKKDAVSNDKANFEDELSKQNLYKTELCRSFMETGNCRYGTKCQFAHGTHEVRPLIRHPKYKTEVCKKFANNGNCPYGNRCRFIHPGVTSEDQIDPKFWSSSWQSNATTQLKPATEEKRSRLAVFQSISQVEATQ